MKKIKNIALIGMIAVGVLCSSCSEDFLKPDPLSFYEPEQTFTTEAGLRSVVATLDRHLRNYWTYYQAANLVTPFYTLFMHTDLAVAGKTDQSTIWADPSERLTPSDGMGGGGSEVNQFSYFWGETYTGIKSANTITSYIGKIKDMDEASRNKYIGWAYFHRAYRYLSLVFMFKDVPLVTKIIEGPKFDYKTTSREAILAKMVEDMEFAVQWVPEQKDMKEIGLVNKGACRMLLSKLYLATGQWEKAIQQLNEVIDNSGYSLMTNTFGTFVTPFNTETWPIQRNVIWDLHRPENKLIAENKEVILGMPNRGIGSSNSFVAFNTMRELRVGVVPFVGVVLEPVVDAHRDAVRLARGDEIRQVVVVGDADVVQSAHLLGVDPYRAEPVGAFEIEEDALAFPVGRELDVALIAPRPVYIASAVEDRWADPKGEFLAGVHATPVYELFGLEGLSGTELPQTDAPVLSGHIGHHVRSGDHDITLYDWRQFVKFADSTSCTCTSRQARTRR